MLVLAWDVKEMAREFHDGTQIDASREGGLTKGQWSWCYREKFLWLGVPQQTTLTPEINLSQYAIEIKCLTLKDQTLYLISDGWSRSPLSFPTSAWIDIILPQQQVNNTSILYIMVLDISYHIYHQ